MYKTSYPKVEEVKKNWFVVDAENKVLGRIASQIASILRGKHKPEFTPHMDNGDFVVVINAEKIRLTGKKMDNKSYFSHSGYIGSEKFTDIKDMMKKHPDFPIKNAVKGMLPHNTLGKSMFNKLKVYAGPEHPHAAQQPKPLELEG